MPLTKREIVKFREVKLHTQSHTEGKTGNKDSNLGLLGFKSHAPPLVY